MTRMGTALLSIAVAVIASLGCGGSGGDSNAVDQKAFDAAFAILREAVGHADRGDITAAERSFDEMHGFSHRLDSELRRQGADATLPEGIDQIVIEMETNLAGPRDPVLFARQGGLLQEALAAAANVLGYRVATAAPKLPDTLQSIALATARATRGAA